MAQWVVPARIEAAVKFPRARLIMVVPFQREWVLAAPSNLRSPRARRTRSSPFHHHEPRDTAIPALFIGVARSRTRLIEVGEDESKCEEFSHVSCKRAMPVNDANARPFYPLWKLLQISIDPIVQVSSILVLDPSIRAARDEAIQVCNQEGSIGSQHAHHLLQAQAKIRYVDECQVADDKVKDRVRKR